MGVPVIVRATDFRKPQYDWTIAVLADALHRDPSLTTPGVPMLGLLAGLPGQHVGYSHLGTWSLNRLQAEVTV